MLETNKERIVLHEQVKIYNPNTMMYARIDLEIVQLIKLIWKFGINTNFSCQDQEDNEKKCGIQFSSFEDFKRFMNLIIDENNEEMCGVIFGLRSIEKNWDYHMSPSNGFAPDLIFNKEDLNWVVARLNNKLC